MNCANCQLTYTKQRKPLVFSCGHTFCSQCIPIGEMSTCLACSFQGKPAVNFAILEHIVKKNTSNIDKYIKICLFGNMDVGKSSLLKRLIDDQFEYKMNPTIGIDFKFIDKQVDGKTYRFQIWDSAGQQRYRAVSSNHLKGSDIIILVYDLSMGPIENGLKFWVQQIMNYSDHQHILLIGNKTDLIENTEKAYFSCITDEQREVIHEKKWPELKVSCLNRDNIDELWDMIIKISKKAKGVSALQKQNSVVLVSQQMLLKKNEKKGDTYRKTNQNNVGKKCC